MADFVGHPGRGPKASHALTFASDHPTGAGHHPSANIPIREILFPDAGTARNLAD